MTSSEPRSAKGAAVLAWLTARSIARGLPASVDDSGGWRVETGAPDEVRRYVFAEAATGLRVLGQSIDEPRISLKLFGTEEAMRAALSPKWRIRSDGCFMVSSGGIVPPTALPPEFEATVVAHGAVMEARICTPDGATVASGFAAETSGCFVYDRIVTEEAFRRRGLARAVVAMLGAAQKSSTSRHMLVATSQGRGLYESLGWTVLSPWTTAVIPS